MSEPPTPPEIVSQRLAGAAGSIVGVRTLAPVEARFAEVSTAVHPRLAARLDDLGLNRLYTHQAEAYDLAAAGKDVVVVTGTSSGKTLCFALPALQHILSEPAARALMIFPTKALAQDQLARLVELSAGCGVRCATYDGDTPTSQRSSIRKSAHVVLTNPDMLHVGILPGHELWARYLRSLRLIAIDEMHAYRGIFGSHFGNILRRLLRLCEWHGARPQIIACSATIGNPEELFGRLTGRLPSLVTQNGAPRGRQTLAFFNPPQSPDGQRESPNLWTARLLAMLAESGARTLAFSRSRIGAELVLRYSRDQLRRGSGLDPNTIESYRAGYTPEERRQIERDLFDGRLMGLSSTNAMELGVDVGGLDAVLMNGYPGTVASFWQQAGRAGRGTREGLAIMVAHDDPLEQFLLRDPNRLLGSDPESVAINPENRIVLEQQIRCAAYERAISPTELAEFGEKALPLAEAMADAGEFVFQNGRFYYPSHDAPAPKVNIRAAGRDLVRLLVDGKPLGDMESWRAMRNAHPGAVYLHRGVAYVVQSLDLVRGEAHLEESSVRHFTEAVTQSSIEPLVPVAAGGWGRDVASLVSLRVTDHVLGYRIRSLDGSRILGEEPLDFEPTSFETIGVRLDLPAVDFGLSGEPSESESESALRELGGLHGLEHALLAVAPFLAGCDRGDIGSAWYALMPDTGRPGVFVFDRTPGGIGLSEKLMERRDAWAWCARKLLETCPCREGCPGCLLLSQCEVRNDTLDKGRALEWLLRLTES
ncbi:MAG: DEAD/DEAH box helicase [Fimbriimonadaceae bacterium]